MAGIDWNVTMDFSKIWPSYVMRSSSRSKIDVSGMQGFTMERSVSVENSITRILLWTGVTLAPAATEILINGSHCMGAVRIKAKVYAKFKIFQTAKRRF